MFYIATTPRLQRLYYLHSRGFVRKNGSWCVDKFRPVPADGFATRAEAFDHLSQKGWSREDFEVFPYSAILMEV